MNGIGAIGSLQGLSPVRSYGGGEGAPRSRATPERMGTSRLENWITYGERQPVGQGGSPTTWAVGVRDPGVIVHRHELRCVTF